MSPRRSVAEARQTRADILAAGVRLASADGLEGLTIGRLATELRMSKSGVLGHFGSKEELQLAVVDAAAEIFAREVPDRVRDVRPGLQKLTAMCAAWVSYLERRVFPGGCFFMAAATEFDDRPGRVHDTIVGLTSVWDRDLYRQIRTATADGDLPADTDADQMVFEVSGVMLGLNTALQLRRDASAPARARRALGRLLGQPIAAVTLLMVLASGPRFQPPTRHRRFRFPRRRLSTA
ncbi:TetR/AcrR family transcriptional regulator [Actinophytocola sp. NPDC049390]|uniref:TetR/AcrR family transcriptional regulator n=1 Tax=Actinophytocola sp. NPDC049390 TaxID=3363894 RepID=UPI00379461DA